MTESRKAKSSKLFSADENAAVVRYQARDVERARAFYTEHLGFRVVQQPAPILAILARGSLHLILSGPGASGSRPLADGRPQEPGGSNRIVLYVKSLDSTTKALRAAGATFRNDVEEGPGGKQILVEDPDGNPVELHEAPAA